MGASRGAYTRYYSISLCLYTYTCVVISILTIFQTKWASEALYIGEWSVFLWSVISIVIHWRHMEFKDRQAYKNTVIHRRNPTEQAAYEAKRKAAQSLTAYQKELLNNSNRGANQSKHSSGDLLVNFKPKGPSTLPQNNPSALSLSQGNLRIANSMHSSNPVDFDQKSVELAQKRKETIATLQQQALMAAENFLNDTGAYENIPIDEMEEMEDFV